MTGREPRPLTGAFTGWTQHGGGASYYVTRDDQQITLYYDIAGAAYGISRQSAQSSRPWSATANKKTLRDKAGRVRIFGSKEAARAAAEKAMED